MELRSQYFRCCPYGLRSKLPRPSATLNNFRLEYLGFSQKKVGLPQAQKWPIQEIMVDMTTGNDVLGQLHPDERVLLRDNGFDEENFLHLVEGLRTGELNAAAHEVTEEIRAAPHSNFATLPEETTSLAALGQSAIEAGELAIVVLNGGMATRFGGQVKGVVMASKKRQKSFLALKAEHVVAAQKRLGAEIPLMLMNSFATDSATRVHLQQNENFSLSRVDCFRQRISLRLTPEGSLYRSTDARVSPYAPGHGDLFEVVAGSEAFQRFKAHGGKYLWLWNVDNLGATIDPVLLGAHIQSQKQVTVEVVDRRAGDTGGAPVLVDGALQLLEGFRFPKAFSIAQVPVFNTNTLLVNSEVMREHPLGWYRADKKVGPQQDPVVQFERIMGEVTRFVSAQYLIVPRSGEYSRFIPVKTPADLEALDL